MAVKKWYQHCTKRNTGDYQGQAVQKVTKIFTQFTYLIKTFFNQNFVINIFQMNRYSGLFFISISWISTRDARSDVLIKSWIEKASKQRTRLRVSPDNHGLRFISTMSLIRHCAFRQLWHCYTMSYKQNWADTYP